jgi:ACR3 family arsenite efflux pump ArsB
LGTAVVPLPPFLTAVRAWFHSLVVVIVYGVMGVLVLYVTANVPVPPLVYGVTVMCTVPLELAVNSRGVV